LAGSWGSGGSEREPCGHPDPISWRFCLAPWRVRTCSGFELNRSLRSFYFDRSFLRLNRPFFGIFNLHALRLRFSRVSLTLRGFCCFLYSLSFSYNFTFSLFLSDSLSRRLSKEKTLVFLFFCFTGFLSSRDSRLKLLIA
jgi:hypothetical protein